MPIRLIEQRRRHEVARGSDNNATGEMFRFADKFRRLLKYWGWVAHRGRRADGKERGRRGTPSRSCGITTERRGQPRVLSGPAALLPRALDGCVDFGLAGVARWAEIAVDIGAALCALANAKIHSNASHPSISTVS